MDGLCPKLRRKLVRRASFNMATGETTPFDDGEWVTEPCGVPLFGDRRAAGQCKSCESGWTHPHNYPVEA